MQTLYWISDGLLMCRVEGGTIMVMCEATTDDAINRQLIAALNNISKGEIEEKKTKNKSIDRETQAAA